MSFFLERLSSFTSNCFQGAHQVVDSCVLSREVVHNSPYSLLVYYTIISLCLRGSTIYQWFQCNIMKHTQVASLARIPGLYRHSVSVNTKRTLQQNLKILYVYSQEEKYTSPAA